MYVFISSKIIGGRHAPTAVEGEGITMVKEASRLEDMKIEAIGSEVLIQGRPSFAKASEGRPA